MPVVSLRPVAMVRPTLVVDIHVIQALESHINT
jgi:hypothetical protein